MLKELGIDASQQAAKSLETVLDQPSTTASRPAIMVNATTQTLTHVGVALTFGLAITVMITATGHLSGTHFNPAVTVAFALTRHFAWRDVPLYIAGQLGGALLGAKSWRSPGGSPSVASCAASSADQVAETAALATTCAGVLIVPGAQDGRADGWRSRSSAAWRLTAWAR